MYNPNPYGLGQQPVRTSYNMLFAHFKQQGYSDELAGAEANRIMRQTSGGYLPPTTTPGIPPLFKQTNIPPYYQQQPVPQVQPIRPQYTKSNLLGGVKLAPPSSASFAGWSLPLVNAAEPPKPAPTNVIPIRLKSSSAPLEAKTRPKGFHNPISTTSTASSSTYSIPNATKLPNIPLIAKKVPIAEKVFTVDTAGEPEPLRIETVNAWIQKLYAHHNVSSSSKNFRKCIGNFVEDVLSRFRAGNLKKSDLVIPTKEHIYKFKKVPGTDENNSEIAEEPNAENVATRKAKETPKASLHKSVDLPSTVTSKKSKVSSDSNVVKTSNKIPPIDSRIISGSLGNDELQRRERRSQRFKNSTGGVYNFTLQRGKQIVGTNEELEKQYLRLTAEPNPRMVRPERVLVKSFRHVFDKFLSSRNYRYIEEQFRSMRQDIQIQHLRNEFVVNVYSTNARIALLHGDLDQFNQCQTQLIELHKLFPVNVDEFECYRLLYLSLQNMKMDILRYLREMNTNNNFKSTPYFEYANMIRTAIAEENFVCYFKLTDTSDINFEECLQNIYNEAFNPQQNNSRGKYNKQNKAPPTPPFYSKLLFKMFEARFRMLSLYTLCRTSITITTNTIANVLNFEDEDKCLEFLMSNKLVFTDNRSLDCKRSLSVIVESPLMHSKK